MLFHKEVCCVPHYFYENMPFKNLLFLSAEFNLQMQQNSD